ncbi:MAG: hypothetical protein KC420_09220 [Myxococcales bacterium]|nr:hypothetical protein [Myxococcales bacterium]MCB9566914.1 hypothetical protein [Myxococcales bacterium]MCB9704647.1 hypothetical protein [Myxococcales bacterium]
MLLASALRLLDDATHAKAPPELIGDLGWYTLLAVSLLLFWAWSRAESFRRSILALEDPRTMAILRIGFALMTIQCFWNMKPYWRMLWSDEGLFMMEAARERLGRGALQGWSPEEGFFDLWAVAKFFWSKYSFFFLKGSPEFVNAYMYAFAGVLLLYAAGVASRVTGLISMVMMCSIYDRNALYLEGTDTVYRVFWFILIFAKTGHAWSFDNWLRCRILRARGKLQEIGAPPDPNKAPIYRLIPAWPRYLMMGQLIGIYSQTGLVKTGSVWANGDALYYALNMDHFYRFEVYTQQISAALGTNVFKGMTYVTHWWEMCFGILGLGMVLKFGLDHQDDAWYRAMVRRRWRLWLGRAALVGAYFAIYYITVKAYPYCIDIGKNTPQATIDARVAVGLGRIHGMYSIVLPILIAAWFSLKRWPIRVWRERRLGPVTLPGLRVDQGWVRRWLFGRRLWLGLGFCFHGILIVFMNIGMFPFIMLMTYAAWFHGDEFARVGAWLLEQMRRVRGLARLAPAAADRLMIAAQPESTVPLRGRRIPDLVVLLSIAVGVGLVLYRALSEVKPDELKDYVYLWIGATFAIALVCRFLGRRPGSLELWQGGPALAYGTLGRTIALAFTLWHAASVTLILFPAFPVMGKWRPAARSIFASYTAGTGTSQSWRMFAPNPPRGNTFMKTVVVEPDGDLWDLRNNSYSYRPFPWIWNDRMRKMHRRMVGKGKWYLKYWAEYHCREWFLETGVWPTRIEIYKITNAIPSPEQVAKKGWYRPRDLKTSTSLVETHRCPPEGLPAFMKERYGIPLTDDDHKRMAEEAERLGRTYENRKSAWERRRDFGGKGPDPVSMSALTVRKVRSALAREGVGRG